MGTIITMQIKKTIETPDGSVTFEGTLSPDELDVVIQTGLSYLFMKGALPIKAIDAEELANILPTDGDVHH